MVDRNHAASTACHSTPDNRKTDHSPQKCIISSRIQPRSLPRSYYFMVDMSLLYIYPVLHHGGLTGTPLADGEHHMIGLLCVQGPFLRGVLCGVVNGTVSGRHGVSNFVPPAVVVSRAPCGRQPPGALQSPVVPRPMNFVAVVKMRTHWQCVRVSRCE